MAAQPTATLSFTKLVVDDLDAMADYYCAVFGLHRATRARFEDGAEGEAIEEISLAPNPGDAFGPLSLLTYESRPAPPSDEVILGFTTDDLEAMLERVRRAGGAQRGKLKEFPVHGLRIAFARDPEGHLSEIVEVRK